MTSKKMQTIGFVRRAYSPSGGAEAYLKRLARGIGDLGFRHKLFTTDAWPNEQWGGGAIARVSAKTPRAFADELQRIRARDQCDVLMSLERVWSCDVYRAGDGVHAAWLERRARHAGPLRNLLRRFRGKHDEIVELERALYANGGARRVIVNSEMVRDEITRFYGYPADRIELVRNGIPVAQFAAAREQRAEQRRLLGLGEGDYAVLFVGSGWERKGLRYAVEAVRRCSGNARLFVVGRGNAAKFRSARTQFIGVRDTTNLYAAADVFLLPTLYDPFSNACLEALASGLPVITTRANGFAEIITPGLHGSVVEDPTDTRALADALHIWSDASRRAAAIDANAKLAANYDITANVQRTLEILRQTAESAAST